MANASRYQRDDAGMVRPNDLVAGYAEWVAERVNMGFRPTMLTFMFNPIPGSPTAVQREMHSVVTRTFEKVLTRTVRRPRKAEWTSLPLWIGCVDWPIYKRSKGHFVNIALNDGAHMHMVALDPALSRLALQGTDLGHHIFSNQTLYFGTEPHLHRISHEAVTFNPERVTDYVLKALKSRRTSVDDILVLPRARAELSSNE